jgi:hypothetical protein
VRENRTHGSEGGESESSSRPLSYLQLCWWSLISAVNGYAPLFKALELPADHKAFGAVMVGYPKLRYRRLPLRNEPQVSYL